MNLITYLMESRGLVNAAQRLPTIAMRFGLSAERMKRALDAYLDIAASFSARPTLFVTGNLIDRYPRVFRALAEQAVDFGIHGYVHTDYAALSLDRQRDDMQRTVEEFRKLGIDVHGFRGPYLGWNADSVQAAKDLGLTFGSNRGIAWKLAGLIGKAPVDLSAYEKGLRLYGARPCAETLSLPAEQFGLLDLPASLPDDEAVVDRLKLSRDSQATVWKAMLDQTHSSGELLVHTLHHERFGLCAPALREMLEYARTLQPAAWIASLREVAEWWYRRSEEQLTLTPDGGGFRVDVTGDTSLTIIAKGISGTTESWSGNWVIVPRGARVEASAPPWIVVPDSVAPSVPAFLKDEGFVVRRGTSGEGSLLLEGWDTFSEKNSRELLDEIESSSAPLVRLWRWPNGARSALSLSSDVDSMSLIDFVRRPLEV